MKFFFQCLRPALPLLLKRAPGYNVSIHMLYVHFGRLEKELGKKAISAQGFRLGLKTEIRE